jgi:phage antirepressor YoqD-like protein
VVSTQPLLTAGGIQQANFVNEDGLYDAILDSRKQEAKQFRKWVTSEILPSIRKTGGYLITSEDDTPEIIMARAILVAQETIKKKDEKLKQLEHRNSILEPKAELMDKVMDTDQKIDIGQAAKILQLPFGRNTLFQKLREKGVFFSNRNESKQEYIKRGYFELKEKWIDRDNHDGFMVVKVLVTQKGLDFIAKLFEIVKVTKQVARIM